MRDFFLTSEAGAGQLQRTQALDIVLHNVFWVDIKELDLLENLVGPF
jgi:hypothetical protein